jgi:6-pyruvoyltetrahydropterin/6-carboxytetrahydropterin synthase
VEIHVEGDRLDDTGMLVDFTVLQQKLSRIIAAFQNTHMNDLPLFKNRCPSTERLATEIWRQYEPEMPANVRITKVRVWETETCAAAFIPPTTRKNGAG